MSLNKNMDNSLTPNSLANWHPLPVKRFFELVNWSGITQDNDEIQVNHYSETKLELFSVKQFIGLCNWSGEVTKIVQIRPTKETSLNSSVKEFFFNISWQEAVKIAASPSQNWKNSQLNSSSQKQVSLEDLSSLL